MAAGGGGVKMPQPSKSRAKFPTNLDSFNKVQSFISCQAFSE